ncbi:LacI family DNA-binding transcriptional regulator [Cryobacterium sp. N22]|uniref:LacI family DNA-binding transcriptional regulator n=1 Tax=Cryobacterium sp. N22 TaxID=2048290 RepID=UPI000CE447BC|nr:LacI family DNA-binding transcriptional regulator [Cryobacterium sp. N22]
MSEDSDGNGARRSSPTIYDVAAAAGVAPSTVSRTFSRPGRVNSETAERIRRIAAEMGYRTNPVARALPTGRTSIIAIIVSDVTNPFFFEIIRGAEETASAAGYTLLVADVNESADAERKALDRTLPLVEGIVLATSRMSDSSIRVAAKQRPTVVLNRTTTDIPSVVTDNARGMKRAVHHLADLGHTSITYVAGPQGSWADGVRWRAFYDATTELDIRGKRVGPFAPTQAGGLSAAHELAKDATSAVISYNDLMAIGMMRGFVRQGISVPDDISVVGFDNIFGSDFCTPPLTTVAAPLHSLGAYAVQTLLAELAKTSYDRQAAPKPLKVVLLPSQLVVRGSTGPRNAVLAKRAS